MKKWEYAVYIIVESRLTELLEGCGNEGWELVQVLQADQAKGGPVTLIFKRPKV